MLSTIKGLFCFNFVCVYVHACVQVRGKLQVLPLSFYYVGSRDQTQESALAGGVFPTEPSLKLLFELIFNDCQDAVFIFRGNLHPTVLTLGST